MERHGSRLRDRTNSQGIISSSSQGNNPRRRDVGLNQSKGYRHLATFGKQNFLEYLADPVNGERSCRRC